MTNSENEYTINSITFSIHSTSNLQNKNSITEVETTKPPAHLFGRVLFLCKIKHLIVFFNNAIIILYVFIQYKCKFLEYITKNTLLSIRHIPAII